MSTLLYVWVGGCQVSSGKLGPEVAGIVLVSQPSDSKCQVPHCIHQLIQFLIWALCGLVVQGPGECSPLEQGHPQCHDFYIFLSWCGFCGTFQGCLTEPSGVTVCGHGTCACCSGHAGYRRQKSLYQAMVVLNMAGLVIFSVL